MEYYQHQEIPAVDTCSECGLKICQDCGSLIYDRAACKACIGQHIDQLMIVPRSRTLKETSFTERPLYIELLRQPDIATDVVITAVLILAMLYVCMNTSFSSYTPYVALVVIIAMIAIVYDVSKVISLE